MKRVLCIGLMILFPSSFTFAQTTRILRAEQDAVREIAFRKLLEESTAGVTAGSLTFYLAVDDERDPSPGLLRQLRETQLNLKRYSESYISTDKGSPVLDKKSRARGIRLAVSPLKWTGKDQVTITTRSYRGNMGISGCSFRVKKDKKVWQIISTEGCYTS